MPFFLIDRDRSDGLVRLLSDELFASREDALAALPALVVSGEPGRDHFVCDLDAATPVLFVPQPAAAPVEDIEPSAELQEPAEVAAEQDEPAIELEEPAEMAAEESAGVWETPVDQVPEEVSVEETPVAEDLYSEAPSLADALRRATNTLESEGIVAPESVPPMSVLEDLAAIETPAAEDEADITDDSLEVVAEEISVSTYSEELASAIASLGVEEPAAEDVTGTPEDEPQEAWAATEWPWANVEQVAEDASESEPIAEEPEDEVEEPLEVERDEIADLVEELSHPADQDDDSLIIPNPDAADFMPRAVIMGDYGDMPAEPASENPPVAETSPDEMEESAVAEVALADEASVPEVVEESVAYEAGDLELGEYSCNDCVYSNTCPKAGSSSPAECGSFQWKAV